MSEKNIDVCSGEKLILLVRNPETLFVLWSFNETNERNFEKGIYARQVELRIFTLSESLPVLSFKFNFNDNKNYIQMPLKEGEYFASLYARNEKGEEMKLLESNVILAPAGKSKEVDYTYGSQFFKRGQI